MSRVSEISGLRPTPQEMTEEFCLLPIDVQRETSRWIEGLSALPASGASSVGEAIELLASHLGVSRATARRKYDEARKGRVLPGSGRLVRGWRALVNWARVPAPGETLPAEFVTYWRNLFDRYKGRANSGSRAYEDLMALWRYTDAPIPGYTERPVAGLNGHPAGWSYTNLMRYAPPKYERVLNRQGRAAAAPLRRLVVTTRVGLEVGQYLLFDDLEHDVRVNFLGVNKEAMHPLELCCLDLFSAHKIMYGLRPTMRDDDTGAKVKLKKRDMLFLLAAVFCSWGYRKAGTMCLAEHGTAFIPENVRQTLFDATAGMIRVADGPFEGDPALLGWYDGRAKGNFRLKAALESHHALVHNATAMLPASTSGNERLSAPEELWGRQQVNRELIEAVAHLPPERAAMLKWPVLHFYQFAEILDLVYRHLSKRTRHSLEGWQKAGLVKGMYRLDQTSSRWLPAEGIERLTAEQRAAVDALIQRPGCFELRNMAPAEVEAAGRRGLVRLPPNYIPMILGEELGERRELKENGEFRWKDQELGGSLRYEGRAMTARGEQILLKEGRTYLTFCNPFNLAALVVCHEGGEFIGVARKLDPVSRVDPDLIYEAMGAVASDEAIRTADYRRRHEPEVEEKLAVERWNRMVLDREQPLTEGEKRAARRIANEAGSFERDLVGVRPEAEATRTAAEEEWAEDGGLSELL